ncbi:MAG: ATP-binding cassette domain-containing protein, partial [Aeromicrobium sp.]
MGRRFRQRAPCPLPGHPAGRGDDLRDPRRLHQRKPLEGHRGHRLLTIAADAGDRVNGAESEAQLLGLRSVSKSYGHVQALVDVDFDLAPGEIVALVGDNGAGKSTIVKILSGVITP